MNLERLRIALQAAGVALVAVGLLGSASYWAIEKLVAAELAPIVGRVDSLEEASARAAKAAEETAQGIARLERQIAALKEESAKRTEALEWIVKSLQRLEDKAHSH